MPQPRERPIPKPRPVELVARLPLSMRRQLLYLAWQRRTGHFRRPRTFSEKVNWRILNDRRPIIGQACDKLEVKELARRRGWPSAETLWQGTDLRELASIDPKGPWVLKPNHRSGLVIFGDGLLPALPELEERTRGWLDQADEELKGEWGYSQARRILLLERQLGPPGRPPDDYKIFVFNQQPMLIQVDRDRFGSHRRRFYTPDFRPLKVRLIYPLADPQPVPPRLGQMLEAARSLSRGFDFVRVDLYLEQSAVLVGELTVYPGGGLQHFHPRRVDRRLGDLWPLQAQPGSS